MTTHTLRPADLAGLVADLVAAGTRVVAPVRDPGDPARADYRSIQRWEEAWPDGPLPRRSAKACFLPPSEVLLRYRQRKGDVELTEAPTRFPPQVLLGVRPCDAAGAAVLDRVMGWGRRDEPWFGRREATTVVSLACPGEDASCVCTALGLSPDAVQGADLLLVPNAAGYLAETVTARGEALVAAHAGRFGAPEGEAEAAAYREAARARVAGHLAPLPERLPAWLAGSYGHAYWKELALRCHGCGACASVCPTCHCFDIVDEHEAHDRGARRRNWDHCQAAKFTVHTSGHNPRRAQDERYRQRIMHKFSIYPRRFDAWLCTGCGRCARACPAGMDLPEILGTLVRLSAPADGEGGR